MRKCPKCHSLVDDERTECCGMPLDAPPEISAAATVALKPEELRRLTAEAIQGAKAAAPTPPPVSRPAAPPVAYTRDERTTHVYGGAARNPAAKRAFALGLLAILPVFPIGLAAFVYGILGLSQASRIPGAPGRGQSWFGLVSGGLFGVLWTAVTVSLLLDPSGLLGL